MTAVSQLKLPLKFRFDRQLWQRFVEVAQPYFYPPALRWIVGPKERSL